MARLTKAQLEAEREANAKDWTIAVYDANYATKAGKAKARRAWHRIFARLEGEDVAKVNKWDTERVKDRLGDISSLIRMLAND